MRHVDNPIVALGCLERGERPETAEERLELRRQARNRQQRGTGKHICAACRANNCNCCDGGACRCTCSLELDEKRRNT